MSIEKMFDEILDKSIMILDFWADYKVSSKNIRKEIEYSFFHNENMDFANKLAYFYALDQRIKYRYDSFFKILFRFFSWKKETKLLTIMKMFLKCPDSSDSKSIILKKSEDFLNGEDCFDSNKNKRNGLKPKNREQEKKLTKLTKEIQQNDFKELERKVETEEKKNEDFVLEEKELEKTETQAEKATNADEYVNINQEPLKDEFETKKNNQQIVQEKVTRERFEVPKEDLQKFEKQPLTQNKIILKTENVKEKTAKNIVFESQTAQKDENNNILKSENLILDSTKKQNDFIPQYEQLSKTQDAGVLEKRSEILRTEDAVKNYRNPNLQSENLSNKTYEQQKNEIVGEEISKFSEKDIQSIKEVLQEEMNKQMNIAEEKGEIFKMPLSIKEVIDQKPIEKSQAQTAKSQNTALKNK